MAKTCMLTQRLAGQSYSAQQHTLIDRHRVKNVCPLGIHSNPPRLPFQLLTDKQVGWLWSGATSGRRWHSTGSRPSSRDAQQLSRSVWQKLRQGSKAWAGHLGTSRRQRNHSALGWHPFLASHAHSFRTAPTSSTEVWLKKLGNTSDWGCLAEQMGQSEGTGRQGRWEASMRPPSGAFVLSEGRGTTLVLGTIITNSPLDPTSAVGPDPEPDPSCFPSPLDVFALPVLLGSTFSVTSWVFLAVAFHASTNLRIPEATSRISSPTPDRLSSSSTFVALVAVTAALVGPAGVVLPFAASASVGDSVVFSSWLNSQNQDSEVPVHRTKKTKKVWILDMAPAPLLARCFRPRCRRAAERPVTESSLDSVWPSLWISSWTRGDPHWRQAEERPPPPTSCPYEGPQTRRDTPTEKWHRIKSLLFIHKHCTVNRFAGHKTQTNVCYW